MTPEEQQTNSAIQKEMDEIIQDLEKQNISLETNEQAGLGDLVENVLTKFGITEERFKSWFNLKECECSKRKKYLNKLLSWKKKPEN
jgi:hypothetical protein